MRELKELSFKSGLIVSLATYFTRGEVTRIEQAKWKDSDWTMTEDGTPRIAKFNPNLTVLEQNARALEGIKKMVYVDDEGKTQTLEYPNITTEVIESIRDYEFSKILDQLGLAFSDPSEKKT